MRSDSETIKMARIANHIRARYGGSVTENELQLVMREYGISKQKWSYYRDALADWGYMSWDPRAQLYCLTPESKKSATFTITVMPSINASAVRLDAVAMFARELGVVEVGEVER